MSTTPKRLAFFGATGDTAGHALAAALRANHPCTALARNASKLQDSLASKGIDAATQSRLLTITQGDIRDPSAVQQTLTPTPDTIISGMGATSIYLSPNPLAPIAMHDASICTDATRAILAAVSASAEGSKKKPLLIVVSTTGIPSPGCPRDVPLLYLPLYKWLLHAPHADKAVMETELRKEVSEGGEKRVRGVVDVKATLLTSGAGIGWEKVRFGSERKPALGWTVARKDVGEWVFERVVRLGELGGGGWECVTITN